MISHLSCSFQSMEVASTLTESSVKNMDNLTCSKHFEINDENSLARAFKAAVSQKSIEIVFPVADILGNMPLGAWKKSSDKAIILPITLVSAIESCGFLVVGCSPYRLLDEKYTGFFSLIRDQVAANFSSVNALEEERKRAEALAAIDRAKTIFFLTSATNSEHP